CKPPLLRVYTPDQSSAGSASCAQVSGLPPLASVFNLSNRACDESNCSPSACNFALSCAQFSPWAVHAMPTGSGIPCAVAAGSFLHASNGKAAMVRMTSRTVLHIELPLRGQLLHEPRRRTPHQRLAVGDEVSLVIIARLEGNLRPLSFGT